MTTYSVQISSEAQTDILIALDYYRKLDDSLARKFTLSLFEIIEKITSHPLSFQIRYRNIRIAFTNTFPYGIHFIIEQDIVYLLSVLHTKRFFT